MNAGARINTRDRTSFCIMVLVGLILNLMQQSLGFSSIVLPDWVFLVLVFWSCRSGDASLLWWAFIIGLVQCIVTDEYFGLASFGYLLTVASVQHARPRLLVVSMIGRWAFFISICWCYSLSLNLFWRLSGDGLQWQLFFPFVASFTGLMLMTLMLGSVFPLQRQQGLFRNS